MNERERRQAKLATVRGAAERDPAQVARWESTDADRRERATEALQLVDQLRASRDVEAFQSELAAWARRPGYDALGHGMLFVHQVVNKSDPAVLADLLLDTLGEPADDADAAGRIRRFVAHVESIKQGGRPAPRWVPWLLSLFWSMADPDRWPVAWPSSTKVLMALGWLDQPGDLDAWYLALREIVAGLDDSPARVAWLLLWMTDHDDFTGLDPSLVDRCRENLALAGQWKAAGDRYPAGAETVAEHNARAALGELAWVGRRLEERLATALGHSLRLTAPDLQFPSGLFRTHFYVRWIVDGDGSKPRLWLRVTEDGVAAGLKPGWQGAGWLARVREEVAPHVPEGLELIPVDHAWDAAAGGGGGAAAAGDFMVGRFWPGETALGDPGLAGELEALAAALQPVFDRIRAVPPNEVEAPPRPDPVVGPEGADEVSLSDLADELLLDEAFLQTVVDLLDDKGQVIFYGPPGTGKTFVAKRLAAVLARDPARHTVVQFHPAMSYEDFFEGYRPRAADGQLTYELVPGPLARIAERAAGAPDARHVLVIDEINRANLAKVLGELLFLLEYRDEAITTLYRPDRPFRLPPNLRVIGTMNSADRSIALVDVALRRRFHFVGWFPEQDQLKGLLGQWLERHDGDVRIAALVQKVNEELADHIGVHLQIGPSYFMREGLDAEGLRRIWQFSIEPYIEEQLFGQTAEIARYRYDSVRDRFWSALTAEPDSPEVLDALDTDG